MAAARDAGTRQDTFVVRLTVDGENWGVWDKKTGGDSDSEATTYYPGAMRDQSDLGGRATVNNITLQRNYDRIDDHDRIAKLLNRQGKAQVTISQRPMDPDANEYGKSIVWRGRLKRVLVPDVDSESSSAALVEIECTIRGRPAVV